MSYINGENRNQKILMPDILDEYITEENPVRVFDAFVDSLDMEACGFEKFIPAKEGRPGYDPRDMLKLYIYGYFNKLRSSRSLAKETKRNVEVMWLINKLTPDFRTISDFRKDNCKALKNVFRAFNRLCDELKLYSKEYISIDGSKFKAVNAKDKNFTLSKLDDRLKLLDNQINEYMRLIDNTDEQENDERSFTKEEITERIKSLKNRRETYAGYRNELENSDASQKSLTDPQAKLMKFPEGYGVGYNVQTAVDSGNHLIAGFEVTDHPTDHGLIEIVAAGVKSDFQLNTIESVADKGYRDSKDLMNCLEAGIIPNVFPSDGKTDIELETAYEPCEITAEKKASHKPDDIRECLRAGVIPDAYKGIVTEIEINQKTKYVQESAHALNDSSTALTEDEMISKAKEGFFVRDLGKNKVYCPMGQILRQKCNNKNGSLRYYNKLACKNCFRKCTISSHKEIDFAPGQTIAISHVLRPKDDIYASLKGSKKTRQTVQIVRLKFRPDRKKLSNRKCLSEHPFGTVKRAFDASYLLLKGIEKATGELALSFLSYNMKRALNVLGSQILLKSLR